PLSFPSAVRFFRGRTLDSEANRLLALTRYAQSRAVSEGIPMILWIDEDQRRYGLQAEFTYTQEDELAREFDLDPDVTLEGAPTAARAGGRRRCRFSARDSASYSGSDTEPATALPAHSHDAVYAGRLHFREKPGVGVVARTARWRGWPGPVGRL